MPANPEGNAVTAAPVKGTDPTAAGVTGISNAGPGVWGQSLGLVPPLRPGLTSEAGANQPATDGVLGEGTNGVRGVSGAEQPGTPASGPFPATIGAGVWGTNTAHGPGVYGISTSGNGVMGEGLNGVLGQTSDASGSGVHGQHNSTGAGVTGVSASGTGVSASTQSGVAVAGVCTGANGFAGKFAGNVEIAGDITAVNTITVSKDVILTGADCAEQFDVSDLEAPEPGTILVIDDAGKLRASTSPYDRRVAGVVSGAGAYRPAIVLDRQASEAGRISVALLGKVYCKVDADPSPIAVGDLLTTSARRGFGMKAVDPSLAFGAIVGKALRPLSAGQSLIPILVALQ
jgi:hypothetical protein